MYFLIAFRNILAHKRKAFITIVLSVICTILLAFSSAFTEGTHIKMIKDAVEIYTGYMEVIGKGYLDEPNYDNLIYNLDDVLKVVSQNKKIEYYSPRFETFALFTAETDSLGGMLIGIKPKTEQYLSRIKKCIVSGRFLQETSNPEAIIGDDLAEKLKVKLGDKLTYLSNAVDSSISADNVKIVGIYNSNTPMDNNMVFIPKDYMDLVFYTAGIASQVIILPKTNYLNSAGLFSIKKELEKKLPASQNQVATWHEILPSLVESITIDGIFNYFSLGILVVIVFFVIMIFSLISILQRTKEIGVLRALGTKPKEIVMMLFAEAFLLGIISTIIGGIISLLVNYYFYIHPIQIKLSEEILKEYQKWGMVDFTIPTKFSFTDVGLVCFIILLMNLLAIIYPTYKVLKLKPIKAINYV